ncbi:MAG: UbiA family prenyltransferase [Isosphaeraceae bacterium]
MARSAIPLLQLVRLPNVLTAAADSLAGWLLVGGALSEAGSWAPLALASMVLYSAGMALNDFFDRAIDQAERPGRPIPSGKVAPSTAAGLGVAGLVLGPALAWLSGSTASLVVAALLSAAILAYDAGLKRSFLGPEIMGACRGLNLLLGMSHAPALGGQAGWLAAAAYGLFVAGITWISRSETESGQTRNLLAGLTLQNLAFLGLVGAALQARSFPHPLSDRPLIPLEGLLVLVLVALTVNMAATRAIYRPVPAVLQRTVKTGILSLIWILVGLVLSIRGPAAAAAVAVLWIPAFALGRWLYST